MCLIFFAYQSHKRYKLILAANRDEYYERPTQPASFWIDNPEILAGRDLKMMGTWLGMNKNGRFAAITNYRDPSSFSPTALSRGNLTYKYLSEDQTPDDYLLRVQNEKTLFNGFNLLVGNLNSLFFYSNKQDLIQQIQPGVYGLSNHLLDTPWPKVWEGKNLFGACIQDETFNISKLFNVMSDKTLPDDSLLPFTGVGIETERMLAPIFIRDVNYGTRSTTILIMDYNNQINFIERTFLQESTDYFDTEYQFKIN